MSLARTVVALTCTMLATSATYGADCALGPRSDSRAEHVLRFVIDTDQARLRGFDRVGAIYVPTPFSRDELRKTGSGTLIDACHVLTAYHVVFPEIDLVNGRPRVFQFDPQRVVQFKFGRRKTSKAQESEFAHVIEGRPLDLGIFDPYAPSYPDELLLVRLNRAAPIDPAPLPLDGDVGLTPGRMEFVAAGFPLDGLGRDGVYRLLGDRCAILGWDRLSGYATNCSLTDGVSGGPLLRMREDSQCREPVELRLAGVANQKDGPDLFPKDHPRRRSFVVPIARNREVIQRAIARTPCPPAAAQ